MRTRWAVLVAAPLAIVLAGPAAPTVNQYKARPLDRQNLGVLTDHYTKQTSFVPLSGWGPSDSLHAYARGGIAATLSVTVTGGPVESRMFLEDVDDDYAIRMMRPEFASFDPGTGTMSYPFTFVTGVAPGHYTVNVGWRSPTGTQVTLVGGSLVVQYGAA